MKSKVRTCREREGAIRDSFSSQLRSSRTSTEVGGDLAVAVTLGAEAAPQQFPGQPELPTAACGLVARVAAKLAGSPAVHESERPVAGAAFRCVFAGDVEGAGPLQPVPTATHCPSSAAET